MVGAAITLYDLVPVDGVAAGHGGYGDPASLSFGSNSDFVSTTDPVRPDLGLAGIIGWTQPASAAVDPTVVVPGYGLGTAQLAAIPPTTDIPCDLQPKTLEASCGQIKTHRIVPVNEGGAAIDTQGAALTFVIEDQEGFDIETGSAMQNQPVGDPLLGADEVGSEIRFTSQAANDMPGEYRFAVRDTETNSPICFGSLIVRYVPKAGDPMPATGETDCPSKFSICLQDAGGNPIHRALVFASTDQDGVDIVDVTISDQAGNAEFTGLEIGNYYVTTEINRQTVDVRPFEVKN